MKYTVHVFKGIQGNVLIIPYGFDQNGIRRALNFPRKLLSSQENQDLGLAVRESFLVSKNSPVIEDVKSLPNVFEAATGIKTWSKFAREHILVDGMWDTEQGYTFEPMERQEDNSYMPRKTREKVQLGLNATDEEIGEAVNQAFSIIEGS